VGFAYSGAVDKVAKAFPDVNFAIIDDAASALPNLANLVFAENQGSYLVGAIAAQASKTGNIGFIGGVNVPLIQKFQAGYEAGAKAVNPKIKIQAKYLTEPPDFSGFGDPAKGKVAAEGMFQNGADVVYHAAGGSGGGVFDAAKAAKGWAIGVDSDQYLTASADVKDVILTSMLKRVDVAVYDYIGSVVNGAPLVGVQTFDLAKDGVGYSTSNPAVDPYKAKTDELAAGIIDGSIVVPDKMG
jgi:basic membrane protein A